jgi:hypothetical protein
MDASESMIRGLRVRSNVRSRQSGSAEEKKSGSEEVRRLEGQKVRGEDGKTMKSQSNLGSDFLASSPSHFLTF